MGGLCRTCTIPPNQHPMAGVDSGVSTAPWEEGLHTPAPYPHQASLSPNRHPWPARTPVYLPLCGRGGTAHTCTISPRGVPILTRSVQDQEESGASANPWEERDGTHLHHLPTRHGGVTTHCASLSPRGLACFRHCVGGEGLRTLAPSPHRAFISPPGWWDGFRPDPTKFWRKKIGAVSGVGEFSFWGLFFLILCVLLAFSVLLLSTVCACATSLQARPPPLPRTRFPRPPLQSPRHH